MEAKLAAIKSLSTQAANDQLRIASTPTEGQGKKVREKTRVRVKKRNEKGRDTERRGKGGRGKREGENGHGKGQGKKGREGEKEVDRKGREQKGRGKR